MFDSLHWKLSSTSNRVIVELMISDKATIERHTLLYSGRVGAATVAYTLCFRNIHLLPAKYVKTRTALVDSRSGDVKNEKEHKSGYISLEMYRLGDE